ncbi:uncharacterized protein ASCRUDRAFT_106956 [Ascoidea rubescens DSM 1968]|uniref:Uncharacterized protein n=1 Tax=Ascoidea rubescens DSM 1968 TaxID=1344418 RepID=A0A1D2VE94_9ASCO|nr:hypothetical protein ASCRUDRAFT_106956 [Ascoidea rubescens DSM 1968]ODV59787.1 hypothetical protein ASCRUDRAFT_106956 [Ascoidea rubescens DSM 1968]
MKIKTIGMGLPACTRAPTQTAHQFSLHYVSHHPGHILSSLLFSFVPSLFCSLCSPSLLFSCLIPFQLLLLLPPSQPLLHIPAHAQITHPPTAPTPLSSQSQHAPTVPSTLVSCFDTRVPQSRPLPFSCLFYSLTSSIPLLP